MTDAIIDEEDREFVSTVGHWTGDMVWQEYVPPLGFGVARFIFSPGDTEKSMSLLYPHFAPEPKKTYQFYFSFEKQFIGPDVTFEWLITDGNHEFSGSMTLISPDYGGTLVEMIEIPKDFNQALARLETYATAEEQEEEHSTFSDNYAMVLETIPRIQYLPIMGVG